MAGAAFTVVLDTHAPVLSTQDATWRGDDRVISIPYTLDKPATITASYEPFRSNVSYPMYAVDGSFEASILAGDWQGRAYITVRDDLLNTASYTLTVGRDPTPSSPVVVTVRGRSAWDMMHGRPLLRLSGVSPSQDTPHVDPTRGLRGHR